MYFILYFFFLFDDVRYEYIVVNKLSVVKIKLEIVKYSKLININLCFLIKLIYFSIKRKRKISIREEIINI